MSTPSEEIIASAQANEEITDRRGRKLAVRLLAGREQSRFYRLAGDATKSEVWTANTALRLAVRRIDGVPQLFPNDMNGFDGLWEKIDDDMMTAVVAWAKARQEAGRSEGAVGESTGSRDSESVSGS